MRCLTHTGERLFHFEIELAPKVVNFKYKVVLYHKIKIQAVELCKGKYNSAVVFTKISITVNIFIMTIFLLIYVDTQEILLTEATGGSI